MSDEPDPKRVQGRADALLPEERDVGSDDPAAQAQEILADSDARTADRVSPPGKPVERRHSEDTVEPPDWGVLVDWRGADAGRASRAR